ncbi:MAG TPA: tetratricopeptide repeat protein [Pyrinomonadaceae bacterium]
MRDTQEMMGADAARRLVSGQATLAEYAGLRREQLYEIARVGYQLMNSGRLEEAREIYRGLVAADPFDSVFHCHLAAVNLRMGQTEAALVGFDAALRFNRASVDALAGRGETYFKQGRLGEAVKDLRAAVELDPGAARPSAVRARALLLALGEVAAAVPTKG